nr:MAG TPA: hypothetical protein [Caudoviricetes sp.]
MKNFEKYRAYVYDAIAVCNAGVLLDKAGIKTEPFDKCGEIKADLLEWLLEECKEPILDNNERNYLSAVIRPFRKRIKFIRKSLHGDMECITICYDNLYTFMLPLFKKGTMYKGMELRKNYRLEELGL